jgi:hypothetical protein
MPGILQRIVPVGAQRNNWRLGDCDLECFEALSEPLITAVSADHGAKDAARVLRVPGFWHLKGEPFQSRLLGITATSFTAHDLTERLGLDLESSAGEGTRAVDVEHEEQVRAQIAASAPFWMRLRRTWVFHA